MTSSIGHRQLPPPQLPRFKSANDEFPLSESYPIFRRERSSFPSLLQPQLPSQLTFTYHTGEKWVNSGVPVLARKSSAVNAETATAMAPAPARARAPPLVPFHRSHMGDGWVRRTNVHRFFLPVAVSTPMIQLFHRTTSSP